MLYPKKEGNKRGMEKTKRILKRIIKKRKTYGFTITSSCKYT